MEKIKEPIFFSPIYKDYIWGGTRLKKYFNKNTPYDNTAESWEISGNKNGITTVLNGKYKNKGLDELFMDTAIKEEIFGKYCKNLVEFPLLVKFIDAKENLSVQVHPDNNYAKTYENSKGKAEAWYIIESNENNSIICGVNKSISNYSKEELFDDMKIKECLNYITANNDDILYIPPGTLHAILKGTLICEIQQNSDITYRVYDWDRVDKNGNSRELHIEKAKDVILYENKFTINNTGNINKIYKNILKTEYFSVDKLTLTENQEYVSNSNLNSFIIVNIIKGQGRINDIPLSIGQSFIIPSGMGQFKIEGNMVALFSYIEKNSLL